MLSWFPSVFLWFLFLPALTLMGGVCRGEGFPQEPEPQQRRPVALAFASERLGVWQKRLNLEDWRISVTIVPSTDLRPETMGNIHWDREARSAVIRILDPAEYKMAWRPMLNDMEFTVVHELIHLELAPLLSDVQRSEANRREEEFTVNHLADALLKTTTAPANAARARTSASSSRPAQSK